MKSARFGLSVIEADSGRELVSRLADGAFAPASNFKLLTAAAALAYLGRNFRYRTTLVARGPVKDGELDGDLIFVGGGDPVLSRGDLKEAAGAVLAAGIRRVTGKVLPDGSVFDNQRYGFGWAWEDFPYYYQAPIQGLSVDEGLVDVAVSAGATAGEPLAVTITPNDGAMTAASRATTTAKNSKVDVECFRNPGSTQIVVVGSLPLGAKTRTLHCAVEDANEYAAGVLAQLLADGGVSQGFAARGAMPANGALDMPDSSSMPAPAEERYPGATILWRHDSPTVLQLVDKMMPPSDNFIADHLFKTLPVAALRRRGSFAGGDEVERKFVGSLGLNPGSIEIVDGSGLSQGNRITPRTLTTLLRWEAHSTGGRDFIHSLARPVLKGTLRKRLKGSDTAGRVWAKTGYIWHASNLSGYAYSKHHGLIAFSIMFNDAMGPIKPFKDAQDEIVRALVDLP